jgi:hypothetical protein
MKKNIIILVGGIVLAVCIAIAFGYFVRRSALQAAAKTTVQSQSVADVVESTFVDMPEPKVLGVSDVKSQAMAQSENYKIKQITFGGEIAVASGNNTGNLQVMDVRSELLMTKDQKDYRFLITWKTNKLATSEVVYSKAGSGDKSLKEKGFGLSHSVVLTQLEASSAYTYVIKTTDQWGNMVTSDKYAMYTSAKALSVFDLIAKEFSGIFSWVNK